MIKLTRLAGVLQLLALYSLSAYAQRTASTSDPAISYSGDWSTSAIGMYLNKADVPVVAALTAGGGSHVAMQTGSTATFTFTVSLALRTVKRSQAQINSPAGHFRQVQIYSRLASSGRASRAGRKVGTGRHRPRCDRP